MGLLSARGHGARLMAVTDGDPVDSLTFALGELSAGGARGFSRGIGKLLASLASPEVAQTVAELPARGGLDAWLAGCRASGRGRGLYTVLLWPEDETAELGLALELIERFIDTAWAIGFAHEIFLLDGDDEAFLARLVEEIVAPFAAQLAALVRAGRAQPPLAPAPPTPAPKAANPARIVVCGDASAFRHEVGAALYERGYPSVVAAARPSANLGAFAESCPPPMGVASAVVVLTARDVDSFSWISDSSTLTPQTIFDLAFLFGRFGSDRVIPLVGAGLKVDWGVCPVRPVVASSCSDWRGDLSARLDAAPRPQVEA